MFAGAGQACDQHRQDANEENAVECSGTADGSDGSAEALDLVEVQQIGADER